MALLMQGCKKEPDAATSGAAVPEATNNPATAFVEPTNAPAPGTNIAEAPTNVIATPVPVEPPASIGAATDYVVVKGDSFSSIHQKFHVTIKALQDANPAVEPTKLKIGQTIHIPAPTASTASTTGNLAAASVADASGAGQTYTVKSGDSLTKIAGQYGITVKALRSANNLKTDKIVVGQKLKIPAKTTTAPAASGPTPAPAGQ